MLLGLVTKENSKKINLMVLEFLHFHQESVFMVFSKVGSLMERVTSIEWTMRSFLDVG